MLHPEPSLGNLGAGNTQQLLKWLAGLINQLDCCDRYPIWWTQTHQILHMACTSSLGTDVDLQGIPLVKVWQSRTVSMGSTRSREVWRARVSVAGAIGPCLANRDSCEVANPTNLTCNRFQFTPSVNGNSKIPIHLCDYLSK